MYSLIRLGIFILCFITSSFAVCPENSALRAEECVAVFTRFRNASRQGPDAILQICSEIYGALDCLTEIINDCEIYTNMGLQISLEDYERIKSGIDPVCGGDTRTVLSNCENKFNECGQYGAQLEAAGALGLDPGARCVVMRQHTECNDQLLEVCGSLMPEEIKQRLADVGHQYNQICVGDDTADLTQSNTLIVRATEKECQTMSESCLTIIESLGDTSGQREVMCNGMRSMLSCLQNVLAECADKLENYNVDTLMAGYQQHLGIYCSNNENETGEQGPMPGRPGSMPGPQQVLSNCENKFNECGQYGARLEAAGAQAPIERCVVMRQHAECNDQLLDVCGSIMPEEIKQRLAAVGQQYNQICPGSNEVVVPKTKTGLLPPAKCEERISKCKSKLVGYEAGNKEKCLQGYKAIRCYRRVAKVCKLARPIRKEIKAFKKSHINTCGKKKPRDVDDVDDSFDDVDDSFDVYIAWLDGDDIDAD